MKKLYFLFLLCTSIGVAQSAGDIVVTEFMADSDAVSDTVGEWLEIYNATTSAIDLNGWTIKDDGSNTYTFSVSVVVPAQSYFVLGRGAADTASNGGVELDFSYGDGVFTLGNSDDEIVVLSPDSTEIDRVNYGVGGFPDGGPGYSISLDISALSGDNNDPTNWCLGATTYGAGDYGTPGVANPSCAPVCEVSLGSHDTTCDAVTSDVDTYAITLAYSGAGASTFVVSATSGTVGGDDPSTVADGTITVSGIQEGVDVTITVDDTGNGGLCALSRTVSSPICAPTGTVDLALLGIIDFGLASSDGKAIHLVATADIADLSVYGIGVANNGGGTDGQEYTFDSLSITAGENILVARNATAMTAYISQEGMDLFDHVLIATSSISQNGDDAIELFKNGTVVETFGDVDCDPNASGNTCPEWEYTDSWAYKVDGAWTYGGVSCTVGTATIYESTCVYPFVSSLSIADLAAGGIAIYPNPVNNGFVTIKSQLSGELNVDLYDIMGRNIQSTQMGTGTLDVRSVKAGIYLLKVSNDEVAHTAKLIIK